MHFGPKWRQKNNFFFFFCISQVSILQSHWESCRDQECPVLEVYQNMSEDLADTLNQKWVERSTAWLLPKMGRTCVSPAKLHKKSPSFCILLLALSSHPAVFICSSHPIFATKLILHWPRMKLCTRQELCTNPKTCMSLLSFLATAIAHLSRSPQAGPISRLASRPVFFSAKAELNGTSLHCSADQMVAFFPPLGWEKACEAVRRELDF